MTQPQQLPMKQMAMGMGGAWKVHFPGFLQHVERRFNTEQEAKDWVAKVGKKDIAKIEPVAKLSADQVNDPASEALAEHKDYGGMTERPMPKINVHYVNPPIPLRDWDYSATFDGYEPGDMIGRGSSRESAILDLKQQHDDEHGTNWAEEHHNEVDKDSGSGLLARMQRFDAEQPWDTIARLARQSAKPFGEWLRGWMDGGNWSELREMPMSEKKAWLRKKKQEHSRYVRDHNNLFNPTTGGVFGGKDPDAYDEHGY